MKEEAGKYIRVLEHSKLIFTTNYDSFIESELKQIDTDCSIYIRQQGFLRETLGYSEIHKIHGCQTKPNSIVLNAEDYSEFDDNSILISAKLISNLVNSPIIFLGYSLTDKNIRKILAQFTSSLTSDEMNIIKDKFIVISREEGIIDIIEEKYHDKELECVYTLIKTDNFEMVFDNILKINQGLKPSELKKYYSAFKELIIDRGKKGELDKLLISPQDLSKVETLLGNKNFVVAFGDEKTILKMPTLEDYLYDYYFDDGSLTKLLALEFMASYTNGGRIPFLKYLDDGLYLSKELKVVERRKVKNRLMKHGNINGVTMNINSVNRCEVSSFDEIMTLEKRTDAKYESLAFHIYSLENEKVLNLIKQQLANCIDKEEIVTSSFRKLMLAYDIKKHGDAVFKEE